MITFHDILNLLIGYSYESLICNTYNQLYCDTCSRNYTWCFIDSVQLAIDYIERGEYYG